MTPQATVTLAPLPALGKRDLVLVTSNATSLKTHYPVTELVRKYNFAKFHQDKETSGVDARYTRSNLGTYYAYQEDESPTVIFLITNYTPGSSAEYNSITKRRIELTFDPEERSRLDNDTSKNRCKILEETLEFLAKEQGKHITESMDHIYFWGWEGPNCLPGGKIYEAVSKFSKDLNCKFSMVASKRNGEANVVVEETPLEEPNTVSKSKKTKRKRDTQSSDDLKRQKENEDSIRDFLNSDEWMYNSQIF